MIAAIRNSLYLAWRYLAFHKGRSLLLVGALSIIVFVPLLLEMVVRESREQLSVRADTTPLLLALPGSALDLVMNSPHFTRERPALLRMADAEAIDATGLARAIPLKSGFGPGLIRSSARRWITSGSAACRSPRAGHSQSSGTLSSAHARRRSLG